MITYPYENSEKPPISPEILVRELILKLALKGHERVLHIGSGDGKVTKAIAACLPRGSVLGIDSSSELIGDDGYPLNRYNNISFAVRDYSNLTFKDEFDIIFSHDLTNGAANNIQFFEGISVALRSGGRVLLQMEGTGSSEEVISRVHALLSIKPWNEYFFGFEIPSLPNSEETMSVCEAAGLYTLRLDLLSKTILFSDDASFEAWIRNIWSQVIMKVPRDQRDGFVSAILREYQLLYSSASDGSIMFQVSRLEIEARKVSGPDTS